MRRSSSKPPAAVASVEKRGLPLHSITEAARIRAPATCRLREVICLIDPNTIVMR